MDDVFDAQVREIATLRLPQSRGREQCVDVYLALNRLLRAEDTPASVQTLLRQLPALLVEFHPNLRHTTVKDVVHVSLRTLSYFMYHRTLAAAFSDAQVSAFLSDIISLLFSTQDEVRLSFSVCGDESNVAGFTPPTQSSNCACVCMRRAAPANVQALPLEPHHAKHRRESAPVPPTDPRSVRPGDH